MGRFAIQQAEINNVLFPGTRGYEITAGDEIDSEGSDSTIYETAHHGVQKKPTYDLTCRNLKSMLAALVSSTSCPMLALDGTNGIRAYLAKAAAGAPGYAAGTVHLTRRMALGVLFQTGLRWSGPRSKVEMALRAMGYSSDGSAASIVSGTAARPTEPVPNEGFTSTTVTIAGSTFTAVNSFDLSIDPKFEWEYTLGKLEPTAIYGAGANDHLSAVLVADVGDVDLGAGTGTCTLTCTQYAQGGGLASTGVIYSLNSAWSVEEGIGGESGQKARRRLRVRSRYDGTNLPLTWSTF